MRRLIRGRFYRWLMTAIIGTLAIGSLTACSAEAAGAHTSTKAPSVVLSNAFIGNQWRQSMVDAFEKSAQTAVARGLISSFKVANAPGQNSATDQIAQLKTILLEDPDILLIDPASPTALAPVISQACSLGITVVVFDSGIESNCAYVVTDSFPDWARESTEAASPTVIGGRGLKREFVPLGADTRPHRPLSLVGAD